MSLRVDIAANFAGRFWAGAAGVLAVPPYLAMLGLEQYGLIGFYTTATTLLSVADFGLAPALASALARRGGETSDRERDLTRTFEVTVWCVAVVVASILAALASYIARDWLRAPTLPDARLSVILVVMGGAVATNGPALLYHQALIGVGRQVTANVVQIIFITLRAFGVIGAMTILGATPEVFFAWQAGCGVLQGIVSSWMLNRALGPGPRRFSPRLLAGHGRYSAAMTATVLCMTVFGIADRAILSRTLPLDSFGAYNLAATVALALSYLSAPICSAFAPRFARDGGDRIRLESRYQEGAAFIGAVLTPVALTLAVFGEEAIHAWTGHTEPGIRVLMPLLVAAAYCNGLIHLAFVMQTSLGRARLVFHQYAAAALIGVPCMIMVGHEAGAIGVAATLALIQASFVVFSLPRVHAVLLPPGATMRWVRGGVAFPLALSAVVIVGARLLWDGSTSRLVDGLMVLGAATTATLLCLAAVARARGT